MPSAQPRDVLSRRGPVPRPLSLNGTWQFNYTAGWEPGADAAGRTSSCRVIGSCRASRRPATVWNWRLAPAYYRRTFHVPADWREKRVFLQFDGVLSGFDVSGERDQDRLVGERLQSGGVRRDRRDQAAGRKPAAVKVTTRSPGWEFDVNDCWALSGHLPRRDIVRRANGAFPDSPHEPAFRPMDPRA